MPIDKPLIPDADNHFEQGRKLAVSILKDKFYGEHPQTALMAAAWLLRRASFACRVKVWDTFELLREMEKKNLVPEEAPSERAARGAGLIVPGTSH